MYILVKLRLIYKHAGKARRIGLKLSYLKCVDPYTPQNILIISNKWWISTGSDRRREAKAVQSGFA